MPPKAEKKNNGFDRLRADLKAQTPQNVYLFYGEETYLRSYYLEELHRLLIPAGFEEFNYHRLSGKGLTVQELAEVTEAHAHDGPAHHGGGDGSGHLPAG